MALPWHAICIETKLSAESCRFLVGRAGLTSSGAMLAAAEKLRKMNCV